METVVFDMAALRAWLNALIAAEGMKPVFGLLFCGDRLSCCDEAVGLKDGDVAIGVATIAPDGEMGSGQPTVVALYLCKPYRGQHHSAALMKAAIDRCRQRGLVPVRVDAMSTPALRTCAALPPAYKADITLHDMTCGGMLDGMLLA